RLARRLPPDERFGAYDAADLEVDDGLEHQRELLALDGSPERALGGEARLDSGAERRHEELDASAPSFFGQVHGGVCIGQERLSGITGAPDDHADAGAREDPRGADVVVVRNDGGQTLGQEASVRRAVDALADDDELVAPETGHGVARPERV